MKKQNQANLLARECLATALIQLAGQKPFSAITISELTKRAGVSRMTYYRNYSSKEEVFQSYLEDLVAAYQTEIKKNGPPESFGEYPSLCHCFRYFNKYKDFISSLLRIGMGEMLLNALSGHLIKNYYPEDHPDPNLYYALYAYAGALYSVYITWLKNGAVESPEAMADIVYRLADVRRSRYEPPTHPI